MELLCRHVSTHRHEYYIQAKDKYVARLVILISGKYLMLRCFNIQLIISYISNFMTKDF